MESEKRKAIEQLIEQHKEEIALLQENHNIALSEVKKKQWVILFLFLNMRETFFKSYNIFCKNHITNNNENIFLCFFKIYFSIYYYTPQRVDCLYI